MRRTITLLTMAAALWMAAACTPANGKGHTAAEESQREMTELPAIDSTDKIVSHTGFTLCYSHQHKQARWVAYMLTRDRARGTVKRTDDFRPDPSVKGCAQLEDYHRSGYSRGHLCPAYDMKWSPQAMSETFLLSNISPQKQDFNDGIWKKLETRVHGWAMIYDTLYVVTGPVLSEGLATIGPSRVSVPEYFYKVVYAPKTQHMIGWVVRHEQMDITAPKLAVTVDSVERLTGIDFFASLPDELEEQMESSYQRNDWDWK